MLPDSGAAAENGDHNRIGALERLATVGGGGHLSGIIALGDDFLTGALREIEPWPVDVDQRDFRTFQKREGEQITNQTTGKTETARADEDDFRHVVSFLDRDNLVARIT